MDAWRRIQANFGSHIDTLCGRDTSLGLLLRAILIYENVNRPAWVRLLERAIVRVPGVRLTVGIAQVMSKRPLSDNDSITKAYELLAEENKRLQDSGYFCDDYSRIESLIRIYNPSKKYHKEVLSVYRLIASEHGSLIWSNEDKRGN